MPSRLSEDLHLPLQVPDVAGFARIPINSRSCRNPLKAVLFWPDTAFVRETENCTLGDANGIRKCRRGRRGHSSQKGTLPKAAPSRRTPKSPETDPMREWTPGDPRAPAISDALKTRLPWASLAGSLASLSGFAGAWLRPPARLWPNRFLPYSPWQCHTVGSRPDLCSLTTSTDLGPSPSTALSLSRFASWISVVRVPRCHFPKCPVA